MKKDFSVKSSQILFCHGDHKRRIERRRGVTVNTTLVWYEWEKYPSSIHTAPSSALYATCKMWTSWQLLYGCAVRVLWNAWHQIRGCKESNMTCTASPSSQGVLCCTEPCVVLAGSPSFLFSSTFWGGKPPLLLSFWSPCWTSHSSAWTAWSAVWLRWGVGGCSLVKVRGGWVQCG